VRSICIATLAGALIPGGLSAQDEDDIPEVRAEVAAGRARAIEAGQARTEQLRASDPMWGSPFHVWRYEGRSGERLVITVASSEFRPSITVALMYYEAGFLLEAGDPHAGNTESRFAFTIDYDGSYVIIVRAVDGNGTGAYTLRVEKR
jgi:hypothetical protein